MPVQSSATPPSSEQPGASDCPDRKYHGNPFRYCSCGWIEASDQGSQLDRIELKLDEVLEFRDELKALMAAFAGGGSGKVLRMVAKAKGM